MKYSVEGLVSLVSIQFLSFSCAIFVLIRCIKQKSILRNLSNHLIICLLLVSMWLISIDLLSTEFYYWNNIVPIQTSWACRFYNFSFFSISSLNRMFMAFMSIERYLLVFRPQLYRIRRLRYFIHYFPILLIILWSLTYSIVTDIFLRCPQERFRYNSFLCGYTCSLLLSNVMMIYVWVQVFLPTAITTTACIILPIRFLSKKRTLQRLQWRRARKMILQMTIIAGTYTLCWLPYAIMVQLISVDSSLLGDYYISRYMIFDCYVSALITPFICFDVIIGRFRFDIIRKAIRFCFARRHTTIHAVQPQHLMINSTTVNRQNKSPL